MDGRIARKIRVVGFAMWLLASTFAAASLTAWHALSLPVMPGAGSIKATGNWHLTHYLSADCACSQSLARHLISRRKLLDATEDAVVIGAPDSLTRRTMLETLRLAGFPATALTARLAAERGIEGVPQLLVHSPDGTLRFRGGYRERTAPLGEYLDLRILSALRAGRPVAAPGIYGCATSRRLKQMLDPLSLKTLFLPGNS